MLQDRSEIFHKLLPISIEFSCGKKKSLSCGKKEITGVLQVHFDSIGMFLGT